MLVLDNDENAEFGFHQLYRFKNGYGASIAKNALTKGGRHNCYEIAIIKWYADEDWQFGPRIWSNETDGRFKGWLTLEQCQIYLDQIEKLPEPELWEKWFLKHNRK